MPLIWLLNSEYWDESEASTRVERVSPEQYLLTDEVRVTVVV